METNETSPPPVPKPYRHAPSPNFAGASVLIYAIDAQWGNTYFLLAKERYVKNWRGSLKWSDFGGSRSRHETPEACASREFDEETLSCVRWWKDESLPRTSAENIAVALNERKFTYRVKHMIKDQLKYVTFIKRIRLDPTIPATFDAIYRELLGETETTELTRTHPARDEKGKARKNFMEKIQLRWFSKEQLEATLRRGDGLKMTNDGECLRQNFRDRLRVILREFPSETQAERGGAEGLRQHVGGATNYWSYANNPRTTRDTPTSTKNTSDSANWRRRTLPTIT